MISKRRGVGFFLVAGFFFILSAVFFASSVQPKCLRGCAFALEEPVFMPPIAVFAKKAPTQKPDALPSNSVSLQNAVIKTSLPDKTENSNETEAALSPLANPVNNAAAEVSAAKTSGVKSASPKENELKLAPTTAPQANILSAEIKSLPKEEQAVNAERSSLPKLEAKPTAKTAAELQVKADEASKASKNGDECLNSNAEAALLLSKPVLPIEAAKPFSEDVLNSNKGKNAEQTSVKVCQPNAAADKPFKGVKASPKKRNTAKFAATKVYKAQKNYSHAAAKNTKKAAKRNAVETEVPPEWNWFASPLKAIKADAGRVELVACARESNTFKPANTAVRPTKPIAKQALKAESKGFFAAAETKMAELAKRRSSALKVSGSLKQRVAAQRPKCMLQMKAFLSKIVADNTCKMAAAAPKQTALLSKRANEDKPIRLCAWVYNSTKLASANSKSGKKVKAKGATNSNMARGETLRQTNQCQQQGCIGSLSYSGSGSQYSTRINKLVKTGLKHYLRR